VDINWPAVTVGLTALVTLGSYITLVERRLGARLTREEHERLCTVKHNQLVVSMSRIEDMVKQGNAQAQKQREALVAKVNTIATQVAVLRERSRNSSGFRNDYDEES
jgi:predicted trehalose synthase